LIGLLCFFGLVRWHQASQQSGESRVVEVFMVDFEKDQPASESASRGANSSLESHIASRYRIERVLHDSQHARTLLAEDEQSGQPVVIKSVRLDALTRGVRTRIEHEASIRYMLKSESLAPIDDFGQEHAKLYIVMPFIAGIDLRERLQRRSLSVEEALIVGKSLFTSLNDLHREGALHRDIKPTTIITNEGDTVRWAKLVDFGTVRSFRPEQLLGERECATVSYMSPEEAGSIDSDVGESSDLYSAGVVLFHCLAGRPPFIGQSAGTILFEHLTARIPDLPSINSDVPRELNELVHRLLRKDPQDRYQLASAVVGDIEAISAATPDIVIGATDRRCTLTESAFVARSDELNKVESLVAQTKSGQGGMMLVEAESGGGKSRLLVEFAKQAQRNGLWVLRGQATTNVGQSPFCLLEGIVEGFLAVAHDEPALVERVQEKLGVATDALCASLPRLQEVFKSGQESGLSPAAFGENRTIHALAAFLDTLGREVRPTVIVLDDCQWADELTCKLIRRWQAQPGSSRRFTSVLVAFRSEEVPEKHVLRSLPDTMHLKLEPFRPAEIKQLAESMAGPLPEQAIEVVTRLSGGSPFMASGVLRGLVESGALISEQGSWRIEPLAMADLQSSRQAASILTRRIELLPEETIRLLSVGAAVGKEFSLDIASSLTKLTTSQALSALGHARERRLIWTRPDGGQFVFVHDQIRASLLERLSTEEQRELHLQAALHLEVYSPLRISDIAYHFDAAGKSEKALEYGLKAAEQARAQFSLEVAEQQYRIAQRGAVDAPPLTRFRIAEGLGDTLMLRGHYDAAAPLFEKAAGLADGVLAQAQIQSKLAELCFKRGDMESATDGFEKALRIIGRVVPSNMVLIVLCLLWETTCQFLHSVFPTVFVHRKKRLPTEEEKLSMRLFSLLTHGCWYCRSKVQCLWAHLRGMNLAEKFPPTLELAHAYSEHAPVMCLVPLFRRAIHYAQRSLELRKSFNDLWGQGQSLNFYSCVLYAASRYSECVEKGREAVRLLEHTGDYWQVHIARYQVAASLYHLGDLESAVEESRANHQSGIELGDEQASGIILDVWARAARGRIADDIVATELQRKRQDAQGQTQVLLADGIQQLYAKRFGAAAVSMKRAVDAAAKAGIRNAYTLPALSWLATAYRTQAEQTSLYSPQTRDRQLRKAARTARKAIRAGSICKNDLPRALREAALVAAMRGRFGVARRQFDQSVRLAEEQGAKLALAETLQHRGHVGKIAGWTDADQDVDASEQLLSSLAPSDSEQVATKDARADQSLSLADRFDTVLDTGRRIASALSAEKIYAEAQAGAIRLLRAEQCWLLEYGRNEGEDQPRLISGSEQVTYNQEKVELAIKTGTATAFVEELPIGTLGAGSQRSALCVPINVRSQLAACLYVTHDQVRGLFGTDEERLADFIATIAGAAMENAEGFSELTTLNTTLEQRVAERTAAAEARTGELVASNLELERTARELLSAEDQLREAKDAAEAANEAKSRFLATMSHEIRTPMNGVLGMTEIALRTSLTDQQRNCLGVIRQSGETLLSLLNDILDLSKIEAGKMTLETIEMDPHAVIDATAKLMGVSAAQKGIELISRIAPEVPKNIVGDPCRLRQVLINLVGNAIKFTGEGEVFLNSHIEYDDDLGELLHIAVQDTGHGIPTDKQAAIFESFQQSDDSTTRRFGGTGLGLSISSQLVSLMDGRIWVDGEVGVGSTFHFTIPISRASEENPTLQPLRDRRILLSCDRPTSRDTYFEALTNAGACCEFVPNERDDAFAQVDELARLGMTDGLVLIDIETSSQATNGLLESRHLERLRQVPVLLLVPATGMPTALSDFDLGAMKCLSKPVTNTELIDGALAVAKKTEDASDQVASKVDGSSLRSLRILVVDDGLVNQEVAVGILELMGHTCSVATTGSEAVRACEESDFDVIFMDLEMPDMGGVEATLAIRERERLLTTHTSIVAMTAHALSGIRGKCLEAGMDEYLSKPIQPDSLTAVLQKISAQLDEPDAAEEGSGKQLLAADAPAVNSAPAETGR
jgi:signal transduction histidine kinase/DNA-binding response OmpR family regulator